MVSDWRLVVRSWWSVVGRWRSVVSSWRSVSRRARSSASASARSVHFWRRRIGGGTRAVGGREGGARTINCVASRRVASAEQSLVVVATSRWEIPDARRRGAPHVRPTRTRGVLGVHQRRRARARRERRGALRRGDAPAALRGGRATRGRGAVALAARVRLLWTPRGLAARPLLVVVEGGTPYASHATFVGPSRARSSTAATRALRRR